MKHAINLIERAQALKTHLEATVAANPQLPAKPREIVTDAIAHAASLAEKLRTISDNYLDLTSIKTGEKDMLKNVHFWDSLPPGQVTGPMLDELVTNRSTTLKILYQGAIDIRQISKFDEVELSIARELGDNFSVHQRGWSKLKVALARSDDGVQAKASEANSVKDFMVMLHKKEVIGGFKFQCAKYQANKSTWTDAEFGVLRKLPDNHPVRFEFDGFNRRFHSFLTGHWFNAYAYTVFEDQLKRLDSDFEIYPRVQFEHATGGRRSKGDFDVIINIGKRLLLVECKSGRIARDDHGRDGFADIVEKTEMLKKAFSSTRIADHTFLLLFNPDANEPKEVHDYFAARGIEAVTPAEIRGVVIDRIRDLGNGG